MPSGSHKSSVIKKGSTKSTVASASGKWPQRLSKQLKRHLQRLMSKLKLATTQ